MTDPIETLARVILGSLKVQMDDGPIPGDANPDSWAGTGGVVDCEQIARDVKDYLNLAPAALAWLRVNSEAVEMCVKGEAGVFDVDSWGMPRMHYEGKYCMPVGPKRLDKPAKEG